MIDPSALTMIDTLDLGLHEARVTAAIGTAVLFALGSPIDFGEVAAIDHRTHGGRPPAGPLTPTTGASAPSTGPAAAPAPRPTTPSPAQQVLLNPTEKGRVGTFRRICRLKAGMVADEGGNVATQPAVVNNLQFAIPKSTWPSKGHARLSSLVDGALDTVVLQLERPGFREYVLQLQEHPRRVPSPGD
jgi:hypothetical protein